MAENKVQEKKKEKSAVVTFNGTGVGLLGIVALFVLSGVLAFIPLPFAAAAAKKWFYKNLNAVVQGKTVTVSYDGGGAPLMIYWLPSLALLIASGGLFYYGITKGDYGALTFLFMLISLIVLIPLPWLWTAKKRYTVSHTKIVVGATPVAMTFSGKGSSALRYALMMIFSLFIAALPLPWALVGATQWCLESTDVVFDGRAYKPTFSGKGGSLFWYGVGAMLSPLFLFLILPALIRGLIAWVFRLTNVIGLDDSIEFEFVGKAAPLFGFIFVGILVILVGFVVNGIFGALGMKEIVLYIAVTLWFILTAPFIKAAFLRWCVGNVDIRVSAAVPVAVGAVVARGGADAAAAAGKTKFDVILVECGSEKIEVIKVVREFTDLGLREAKELVESAPKPVKEGVSKDTAEEIKKRLEAAGGKAEIK